MSSGNRKENKRTAAKLQELRGRSMTREVTGEEEEMKGPVYIDSYSRAWPGCRPWRAPRHRCGAQRAEEWGSTRQCASNLATPSCHTQMLWLSLGWDLPVYYFCLQAATLPSSGNRVSGPITPHAIEETHANVRCHFFGADGLMHH